MDYKMLAVFLLLLVYRQSSGDSSQCCPDNRSANNGHLIEEMKEHISALQGKIHQLEHEKIRSLEERQDQLEMLVTGKVANPETNVCGSCRSQIHKVANSTTGKLPRDCAEIHAFGERSSGVYMIKPDPLVVPFNVYCEIDRAEGWTVIMARYDGSVKFNRTWSDYVKGFGDVFAEHWLGNDHIFQLTNHKHYKLRVDLTYWGESSSYTADYSTFRIESELDKYKLHVGGYSGNSGYDGLSYHNEQFFSTFDEDNDRYGSNCAKIYTGAFWYDACHKANPTGLYQQACTGSQNNKCMEWNRKPTKIMILKLAPKA